MSEYGDFQIRPVCEEDRDVLLKLSARLTIGAPPWRDPAGIASAARGWIESSLATANEDGRSMMVAVLDGHVVGLVSMAERRHFTGVMDAYVGELITDEAFEGRGAGRALMAAVERWAAGRGLSRITLDTGARNPRARRFYERVGFEEEEIRFSKAVRA